MISIQIIAEIFKALVVQRKDFFRVHFLPSYLSSPGCPKALHFSGGRPSIRGGLAEARPVVNPGCLPRFSEHKGHQITHITLHLFGLGIHLFRGCRGFFRIGRLHRRIESQKICLKCDLVNGLDDLGGLFARVGNFIHGMGKISHGPVGFRDHFAGIFHQAVRLGGIIRSLFRHERHRFFLGLVPSIFEMLGLLEQIGNRSQFRERHLGKDLFFLLPWPLP